MTSPRFVGAAIWVRYAGPTDYRGSRWIATADLPVGRAVVGYDHAANAGCANAQRAAHALLARNHIRDEHLVAAVMPDGSYVFLRV